MFASNKAPTQQKRTIRRTGFCGGFTRGPVVHASTTVPVRTGLYPTLGRARVLALRGGARPAAVWDADMRA